MVLGSRNNVGNTHVVSRVNITGKVAAWLLAISVIASSLVMDFRAWDETGAIRHFVTAGLVVAMLLLVKTKVNVIFWVLLAMFCAYLISGFWAYSKPEWVHSCCKIFLLMSFAVVLTSIDRKILLKAIPFLALGIAVFGICQLAQKPFPECRGLMGTRNFWSATMMLMLPFCVKKHKFICLLLLVNIVCLCTKSVFIALPIMALIYFDKKYWSIVGLFIIIAIVLNYQRLGNFLSSQERLEQWQATLCMIKDYPLGVGAGNWKLLIPEYSRFFSNSRVGESLFYTRPHNDYLWIWAEVGILGLLCYLWIFGYAIWKCKDKAIKAGLVGFCIFSFFSFPLERTFLMLIVLLLLCMAVPKTKRIECKYILIPILLFSMFIFWQRNKTSVQARAVREAGTADDYYKAVENISEFSLIDDSTAPLHLFRGMYYLQERDYEHATKDFERAFLIHPNHPSVLVNYATSVINTPVARECLDRALKIRPGFQPAIDNLKYLDFIEKRK